MRAPVLLRIDTELSGRYRPRLVEISRPERKHDDTRSDDDSGLPDWRLTLKEMFRKIASLKMDHPARRAIPQISTFSPRVMKMTRQWLQ